MSESRASTRDVEAVSLLLGRPPSGRCHVIVRRPDGSPVVIENAPHLDDGTPMPTLYWLVDASLREQVSRIESQGGVHRYEDEVDPEVLAGVHEEYAARRSRLVTRHDLPQPSGGVGGTRTGVKCLHAHVASFLAGLKDPVGDLVAGEIHLGDLVNVEQNEVEVVE